MKILVANYRYFISGGPERYMFNLIEQLSVQGHEVIPFSIHYSKNITAPCVQLLFFNLTRGLHNVPL